MMKNIYEKKEIPKFLDENANKLLMQARDIYETLNLNTRLYFYWYDFIRWFPWVGTKQEQLLLMISQFTESKVEAISDTLSLVLNKDTIIELKNYLLRKILMKYMIIYLKFSINLDNIYLPNTGNGHGCLVLKIK